MNILHPNISISTDEAFTSLFDIHWNNVYQLCKRYCGNEAVAKDLTQNIFLSVWDRHLTFEDEQSAWQYLAKSARYQVLNHIRNQKPNVEATDDTITGDVIETNRYNPERIYLTAEFTRETSLKISMLAEPGKTIFLLSREQDLSYRQIAEHLGIAVKTVEKHMSRVLQNLRLIK